MPAAITQSALFFFSFFLHTTCEYTQRKEREEKEQKIPPTQLIILRAMLPIQEGLIPAVEFIHFRNSHPSKHPLPLFVCSGLKLKTPLIPIPPFPSFLVGLRQVCRVGQNHVYGMFGREITIHTVIYGVNIRYWPTLQV
jgi:hypothetical protein